MQHELQQQRSLSLSPTARMASPHTGKPRSNVAPPSPSAMANHPYFDSSAAAAAASDSDLAMPSLNCPSPLSGHPRSVSADGASALSQAQMIRRLIQQNSRIRETWEAERKYLEANRERVEEVYKEERALMEEERVEWEEEKTALMQNIKSLEQQLFALGANNNPQRLPGARATGLNGAGTAGLALRGGIVGGIAEALGPRAKSPSELAASASSSASPPGVPIPQRRGFPPNGGDASPAAAAFQPRSAWGSAALSPVQAEFRVSSMSERVTPSKQPESSPFFPQQPASIPIPPSSTESMASTDRDDSGPIPVVDIQEIHPELEGIPIKAPTIQKTTFTDKPASPTAKPVGNSSSSPPPPPDAAKSTKSRRAGRDQTLQALAADESDRLILHAGHTPNHSLSLLPTAPLSQATTASSSGGSTPKQQPEDENETLLATDPNVASQEAGPGPASESPHASPPRQEAETAEDHPEPLLEPTEDIALRGPLMVRNMPAHDEIFFRKLSDKLEEVSKGSEASVPAVLRVAACAPEETGEPEKEKQENNNNVQAGTDVDGAPATAGSEGSGKDKGSDDEGLEIPLKLKKSNNFGAPFGEFR